MAVENFSISGNDIEVYALLEKPVDCKTIKGDSFFAKNLLCFTFTHKNFFYNNFWETLLKITL